jgi:glycosyltransferase involved in cell wall biosynthesis
MEVPALLRLCEAGALVPSRNEGLSNTILEYMAARLPVLATDCGGNRELVRDGETGRLVSPDASAGEVALAWVSLLRDREQAAEMGRRAQTSMAQRHASAPVLETFRRFYEKVAAV